MTGAFLNGSTPETVVTISLGVAAAVSLIALVVVIVLWRRDAREARFLRRLADADGLGEAMRQALQEAQKVTGASAALMSAGERSGEQVTETTGMTSAEAEVHRFGHGGRVRSVMIEVEGARGISDSFELDHPELNDGELERVSEDPRVRAILIRYDVSGEALRDGATPIASGLAVPIRAQGVTVGVLSVFSRTVTRKFTDAEQRAVEKIAARVAPFVEARLRVTIDELTSLNNFRFFRQTLVNEVAAAQRYDRRLGLLAFDLDGFKAINDTPGLGHAAGDTLLQAVARQARAVVRRSDITCRKGGDEFVIILSESGLDGADLIYQRLRREVTSLRVEYDGRVLSPVGVSAGAVELRRDDDAESFFLRADEALYRARAWGKGRLVWGDGDRPEPPPEAGYGEGNAVFSCSGCVRFRPGTGRSGYCEEWHAPVEPAGACRVFESRGSS